MTETSIVCPSCQASYRRGSLRSGARVTCKKCGTAFVVDESLPEMPAPEAIESAPEAPAPAAPAPARERPRRDGPRSGPRTGPSARRRTGARARAAEAAADAPDAADAPKGRGKTLMLATGGVAVLAVGLFLAFGTGKEPAKKNAPATQVAPAPKVKTGKELFDDLLARARSAQVTGEKVSLLQAAADTAARGEWPGAKDAPRQIEEEILLADPDNARVRTTRNEVQYHGQDAEWRGKWVTVDRVRDIDSAWIQRRAELEKKTADETEATKWDKDPWTKRAKRVSEVFTKVMPEGMKLRFIFDRERVKRPYLLMVEDVASPDPVATADGLGPGLTALRAEFEKRYHDIIPSWDDSLVVPVMCFKDVESYKLYRKDKPRLPSENLAAAFYVSWSENPGDYRGTLFVWQGEREKYFHEVLFHEATHQLMHNASEGQFMGATPWLQEGIAEFFGAYEGNRDAGYTFGLVQESRTPEVKRVCREYLNGDDDEREKPNPAYLTIKQLVRFDRLRFERLKAGLEGRGKPAGFNEGDAKAKVSQIYAEGWAFIHFCYEHEKGKYRKQFEELLAKEFRHDVDLEVFSEIFKMKSDEDWAKFSEEFFTYCFHAFR